MDSEPQPEWGCDDCDGGDAMALAALGIGLQEPAAPPKKSPAPAASDSKDLALPEAKRQKFDRVGVPKPSKRTPRQCKGCQLWFAEEDMAIGQPRVQT